ncbi:MAG: hypothetical protein RML72_12345, partial [Bacteroidia bacterium]|nr:hypothetical protein [Bacteroidia bacterium]
MNKVIILITLLLSIISVAPHAFAQQTCPSITASPSQTTICAGNCANLSATALHIGQTNTYAVASIPYNPPYAFTLGTQIFLGDDQWSDIINLPFNFCFFGNSYNQVVIGSNGLISFNTAYANGFCPWSFTASVPSNVLPLNAIYGVYHDLIPPAGGQIRYTVQGTAPCRTFVVN